MHTGQHQNAPGIYFIQYYSKIQYNVIAKCQLSCTKNVHETFIVQLYIPLAITLHCIVFITVVLYFIVPQRPIPYFPQERGVVFGSFR